MPRISAEEALFSTLGDPGTRGGGPGGVVTWRKCQIIELVTELAQTGWRETGTLSMCTDRQREEEHVEMNLPEASQSTCPVTSLKAEYKMSYAICLLCAYQKPLLLSSVFL